MSPIRIPTWYGEISTLHIPHHATPATHVPVRFAGAARSSSCIVGKVEPIPRFSISDAAGTAVCCLVCKSVCVRMPYLLICISAEVFRQIKVLCCSYGVMWGVEGGGGLPVRRQSYGRQRVELWRASDWLKKRQKTVESQAE